MSSAVVASAVPFIILPFVTRFISPEEYANFATYQLILAIILVFIGLSSQNMLFRTLYDISPNTGGYLKISCLLCFLTIPFAAMAGSAVLYFGDLTSFDSLFLIIALIHGVFLFVIALIQRFNLYRQDVKKYSVFEIGTPLLSAVSIIILIPLFPTWESRALCALAGPIIFGFIAGYRLQRIEAAESPKSFSRKELNRALNFGFGILPYSIAGFLATYIDRLFVVSFSFEELGVYAIAAQLASVVPIAVDALNKVFKPYLFELMSQKKITSLYWVAIAHISLITAGFIFVEIVPYLSPFIVHFLGESYIGVTTYIGLIVLYYCFKSCLSFSNTMITFTEKMWMVSFLSVLSVILLVCVTFLYPPNNILDFNRYMVAVACGHCLIQFCVAIRLVLKDS